MQPENRLEKAETRYPSNINNPFLPSSPIKHILAPTDLSEHSERSVRYALYLARRFNAQLTLLHVWQGHVPVDPTFTVSTFTILDSRRVLPVAVKGRDEQARAEWSLRSLLDRIRIEHRATDSCFLIGEPADLITAAVSDFQADLLVISAHRYNWLRRLIEKSESDKIIRKAPCPVLVFPETAVSETAPEPIYEGTNNVWFQTRGKTALTCQIGN